MALTAGSNTSIEIGPDGLFYLKVIPNGKFDRIYLELTTSFSLVGMVNVVYGNPALGIRDVFYYSGAPFDCDKEFLTTNYNATGITANVLSLSGNPVSNPSAAIDDDPNNYSTLGYGTGVALGIGSTISQSINFNRLSSPGDEAVVEFSQASSILDASILNNITVKAYNGDTKVYENNLNSLINGDILGIISNIFGSTRPKRVSIPVGARFDRIEVSYSQLINAGIITSSQLKLYGVYRVPVKPKLTHNSVLEVCGETNVTLNVDAPILNVTYTWFNSSLQPVHTGPAYEVISPVSGQSDTFFVASSRCEGKFSEYVPVVVKGDDSKCKSSVINGTIDLTGYFSDSTVHAVLLDDSGKVVSSTTIDPTTGNYKFENTGKGNYKIALLAGSVPPAIGSTVSGSNLGTDYKVTPDTRTVQVLGTGAPATVDRFAIEFIGPDLKTSLTAPGTSASSGKILKLTYRVFNIGKTDTRGSIDVVISKPATGTLTVGPLPGGVTMSTTPESIFLKVTNTIQVGPANAVTIPATYTAPGSIGIENLTVTIPAGHGGGEKEQFQ